MPLLRTLLLPLCLLMANVASQAASHSPELFDKPLTEKHIALPRDPHNPSARPMLSCFYYPEMMVRQEDRGEVGAATLAIRMLKPGSRLPACTLGTSKDEHVIDGRREWSGYFVGAKNAFVFFSAEDGSNGGEGFAVFNRNGDRLFVDLAGNMHAAELLNPSRESGASAVLRLRYERFYPADCSLLGAGRETCWEKLRHITGLAAATPPDCTAGYRKVAEWMKGETPESLRNAPSVIVYDVIVTVDEAGTILGVAPAATEATGCHPAD